MIKIAVIIPTFNRKVLLERCLEAIADQTLKPCKIFIVDNHSNDGTPEYLSFKGYDKVIKGIPIDYNYLNINGGGAMGFCIGMQTAYKENKYDAFWMLDDDGLPDANCLEYLSKYVEKYGYVSPILMNINNPNELNVSINGSYNPLDLKKAYGGGSLIKGYCNPFNGGLYSKHAVEIVGFPKKELFIYGDEQNYHQRMKEAGFEPYGVFEARHNHPILDIKGVTLFANVVNFKPIEWRTYCICRNAVYNKKVRKEFLALKLIRILYYYLVYTFFFIIKMPSFKWLKLFNIAFFDGLKEKWNRQYKYLKK